MVSTQAPGLPYNKALSLNVAVAWLEACLEESEGEQLAGQPGSEGATGVNRQWLPGKSRARRALLRAMPSAVDAVEKYAKNKGPQEGAGAGVVSGCYCFHDVDLAPVDTAFLSTRYFCEGSDSSSSSRQVMRAGCHVGLPPLEGSDAPERAPDLPAPRVPRYRLAQADGEARTPLAKYVIRHRLLQEPRHWRRCLAEADRGAAFFARYGLLADNTLGLLGETDASGARPPARLEPVQHMASDTYFGVLVSDAALYWGANGNSNVFFGWERGSFFTDISEPADGERRGPAPIGSNLETHLIKTFSDATLGSVRVLGVRRHLREKKKASVLGQALRIMNYRGGCSTRCGCARSVQTLFPQKLLAAARSSYLPSCASWCTSLGGGTPVERGGTARTSSRAAMQASSYRWI